MSYFSSKLWASKNLPIVFLPANVKSVSAFLEMKQFFSDNLTNLLTATTQEVVTKKL